MRRKPLYLSTFIILVSLPVIFSAYYCLKQAHVRYQMNKALASQTLIKIVLPGSAITWLKKDKEILVNGEPFDIKSYRREGDLLVFYGLYDKAEKELKRKLLSFTTNGTNKPLSNGNSIFHVIFMGFYFTPTDRDNAVNPNISRIGFKEYRNQYFFLFLKDSTPPPRSNYPFLLYTT